MRDSGNKFQMFSDAHKQTVVVRVDLPAKLKLVTFKT